MQDRLCQHATWLCSHETIYVDMQHRYVNNRIGFCFRDCLPWLLSRPLHLYGGHRQQPSHKEQKWRKSQRLERMATISMPPPLDVMTSKYFFKYSHGREVYIDYTINHWKIRKIWKDVIHYPFNSVKWFCFSTICKQCTITLWALMFFIHDVELFNL